MARDRRGPAGAPPRGASPGVAAQSAIDWVAHKVRRLEGTVATLSERVDMLTGCTDHLPPTTSATLEDAPASIKDISTRDPLAPSVSVPVPCSPVTPEACCKSLSGESTLPPLLPGSIPFFPVLDGTPDLAGSELDVDLDPAIASFLHSLKPLADEHAGKGDPVVDEKGSAGASVGSSARPELGACSDGRDGSRSDCPPVEAALAAMPAPGLVGADAPSAYPIGNGVAEYLDELNDSIFYILSDGIPLKDALSAMPKKELVRGLNANSLKPSLVVSLNQLFMGYIKQYGVSSAYTSFDGHQFENG